MLIPKTLFFCIQNERGLECIPLINMKSIGKKRWWNNLSEAKRKAHCRKRARSLKKYLKGLTPEEMQERVQSANETRRKQFQNPETRGSALKQPLANFKKINDRQIIEEVPRINDYSGVITESQMAELNA